MNNNSINNNLYSPKFTGVYNDPNNYNQNILLNNDDSISPRSASSFDSRLSSYVDSATGSGTRYYIKNTDVQFDIGGDLDANGWFTAPVDGIYYFTSNVYLVGLGNKSSTKISAGIRITGEANYYQGIYRSASSSILVIFGPYYMALRWNRVVDIDTGDQISPWIRVSNAHSDVDINADDGCTGWCGALMWEKKNV